MEPAEKWEDPNYWDESKKLPQTVINSFVKSIVNKFFHRFPQLIRYRKLINRIIVIGFAVIVLSASAYFILDDHFNKRINTVQITQSPILPPGNLNEAKVLQAMQDRCNASNNFDSSIWNTRSMQVAETDADTDKPKTYEARKDNSYQSLMVFEIPCKLPFTATISAEIRGDKSIGQIFEFDNVLQVIVGDGDMRAIRYKAHTIEDRKYGWQYINDANGNKITHWIPEVGGVAPGSQLDTTIKLVGSDADIMKIHVYLAYKPLHGSYKNIELPIVQIKSTNYNVTTNIGKFIRVGINDFSFGGTESKINFERFSITSGRGD